MTDAPLAGFITKKEVTERFDRSHRSLTRDLSTAVRTRDSKVLPHLRLKTEDGVIREGTEVSLDMIQELSNQGLTPTWYLRESWVQERYGKAEAEGVSTGDTTRTSSDETKPPTHQNDTTVSEMLRQRIQELEQDKTDLKTELQIKNEQIKAANERAKETNVLMQELHKLLENFQGGQLPTPPPPVIQMPKQTPESESASDTEQSVPRKTRTPRQQTQRKPAKTRPPKNSVAKGGKQHQGTGNKPRWYDMPTINRFLSAKK